MFERLLKGVPWFAVLGALFFKHQFFTFQLGDALFIGRNHRAIVCINNPVKKLFNLFVETFDIALEGFGERVASSIGQLKLNSWDKAHDIGA